MAKIIPVVAGIVQFGRRYGEVLLTKKDDSNHPEIEEERWKFPGGKVEVGESLDHALAREIREELGITIETLGKCSPRVVHAQVNKYGYDEDYYLVIFMECFPIEGVSWGVFLEGGRDCALVDLRTIGSYNTLPGTVEALRSI